MAKTAYGVNHPLAVKKWSRDLMVEMLKETYAFRFMGKGKDSLCQIKNEVRDVGDKVTFGLRMQLSGTGVSGDDTLEGNEEALTVYNDSVVINQLRHAVRSKGKMSEQRVPFSVRNEAKDGLSDWWSNAVDTAFFNQLAGYDPSDIKQSGMQAATAPSTNRKIIFDDNGTTHAAESSIDASDTFQLKLIDWMVEKAKTATPLIRPLKVMGKPYYVLFLHPYQVTDLRTATDTGNWQDIQKAALQGGNGAQSPIFTGALGIHNGVVLHESTRVPTPSSNVYRAVFCGAQSAAMAFGKNTPNANTFSWNEEIFDYGNSLGVAAGAIWGMKKCIFNSEDFGTIVTSTYGAAKT